MIYFAHRGANTRRVQNTVSAFALAHAQGATHYELDVHLLKDGRLAVHHDYSLVSTTGQDVQLGTLTSRDLTRYPLINPFTPQRETIPLLEEILPIILPGMKEVNIELKNDQNKYPGIEQVLLTALQQYPGLTSKVLISSFDYDALRRVRMLDAQIRIGLLTRQFDVQKALDIHAQSVHINHIRLTSHVITDCHQNGLKVYCYTVNDPALAVELAARGVDGIFTDDITAFSTKNPT